MSLEGAGVVTESPEARGLSRRDAMKKAAVGGAIVWAAPMITSMPASATVPSGCVQTDVEFGAPGTMFNAVTVAGVEITRSTVMDGGAVAQADNLTVVQNQGGLTGSFVRLNQSAIRNAGNAWVDAINESSEHWLKQRQDQYNADWQRSQRAY